jgi:hypothetical protein
VNNSATPRLKRHYIRFSVPGEAEPILKDFIRRLGFYANEAEFVESVVAYSLWCEQMHHLTGPSFASRELRAELWDEVVADYGKPKKAGSYFLHRVEEFSKGKGKK